MNNPYSILGVQENASDEEIKKAYRRLAKQHHPDRPDGNEEQFKRISEAYDAIKSGNVHQQQTYGPRGWNQPGPPPWPFSDEMFNEQFGVFTNRPKRNNDTRIQVSITLNELLTQATRSVNLKFHNGRSRQVVINIPRGVTHGTEVRYAKYGEDTIPNVPPGSLFVVFLVDTGNNYILEEYNLIHRLNINVKEAMLGTDKIIKTADNRNLKLNIKPGTQSKTRLRIPQGGLPRNNAPSGDMFVELNVVIPKLTPDDSEIKIKDLP
jgi:DnaJ-class molecular chaperone